MCSIIACGGVTRMSKPKLMLKEQIEYMRDKKGVLFNIISEEEALEFLEKSNYYFKLKSFAHNYEKYADPNVAQYNKYIDLEFAYLKELSTIDADFRYLILKLVLDVEHFLKVQLITDVSQDSQEDGYSIVSAFLSKMKPHLQDEIMNKSTNSYCKALIEKYKDEFAVWNLIEVISFGDFIDLYEFYYSKRNNPYSVKGKLYPIKWLRNAAAHNNCLLNNLSKPFSKRIEPNKSIMNKIAKIKHMPKKSREKKMQNPPIHDFVVLLDVYFTVIRSNNTLKNGINSLNYFFKERCLKNKEYFQNNDNLKSNYEFLMKVVDFYCKTAYNKIVEQKA